MKPDQLPPKHFLFTFEFAVCVTTAFVGLRNLGILCVVMCLAFVLTKT
jgi:hypothetical protein